MPKVRFVLLALALVLCTLAGMSSPAKAKAAPIYTCGPNNPPCNVDQDCNAYCQPCGLVGACFYIRVPPGSCVCVAP
jgi:hypothetical protein